jgi:polysaccharide export outer membrane protein
MGKMSPYNKNAFFYRSLSVFLTEPGIVSTGPVSPFTRWREMMRMVQIAGLFVLAFCLMAMPAFVSAQQASPGADKAEKKAVAPKAELQAKQATAQVAADSGTYVIGPEDVLYIYIWKEETLSRTVPVRMDGMISIPLVDDVKAAGLTPLQLKERLLTKLREYVETPDVTVVVTEANSYKVYVQGEVRNPGVVILRTETSLVQLIVKAGGFTDWADKKNITIIRKEGGKDNRIRVNYKKIIDGDEGANDIILKSGDIIVIPN